MPGVPKASPEATLSKPPFEPPLSDLALESDTCPEYPSQENPSGCRPSSPPVPETLSPGVSPGDHPSAPRVPSRETTRVPLRSTAKASPGDPRALGEYATCPRECFFFHRILENTQKIVRTLEMHNK